MRPPSNILYLPMLSLALMGGIVSAASLSDLEILGKTLFFDDSLSDPPRQACAACHGPHAGFTGPIPRINRAEAIYPGAVHERTGNRKPPSAAYATTAPVFDYHAAEDEFVGGNFWNGRATGWELGNPAADQAQKPFLNPVEQNNPDEETVVSKVCDSDYAELFIAQFYQEFGSGLHPCDPANVSEAYDFIALAIAEYEGSEEVNAYSSKYDLYLTGEMELTEEEKVGLTLFKDKCASCHPNESDDGKPLFTDYTYDNLGVPRNPQNPWYEMDTVYADMDGDGDVEAINPLGDDWVDYGLGGFLWQLVEDDDWRDLKYVTSVSDLDDGTLAILASANDGKQKVPTLRNVDKRPGRGFAKAYMHNGYFKSLWQVVHFLNTRDLKPECEDEFTTVWDALAQSCWPEAEVTVNVSNTDELGNLGLTSEEEDALVSFMETLSDVGSQGPGGMRPF